MIIWDGIYEKIEDVPKSGGEHNSQDWVNQVIISTKIFMGQYFISQRQYLKLLEFSYKILFRIIKHGLKEKIRGLEDGKLFINEIKRACQNGISKINILDIGGAMGVHYILALKAGLEQNIGTYTVVEVERIAEEGNKFWKCNNTINFLSEFPNKMIDFNLDIVYSRNAIQYMDDYKKALKIITDYNPNLIIFERTPFGKHPTYFTCQMNLGNAKIPCQMINYEEFKQIMSDSGYQLKYEYLGPFDRYIENLPPEYRPNTFADLIFEKENC